MSRDKRHRGFDEDDSPRRRHRVEDDDFDYDDYEDELGDDEADDESDEDLDEDDDR